MSSLAAAHRPAPGGRQRRPGREDAVTLAGSLVLVAGVFACWPGCPSRRWDGGPTQPGSARAPADGT
jgi:hypothetical protein